MAEVVRHDRAVGVREGRVVLLEASTPLELTLQLY